MRYFWAMVLLMGISLGAWAQTPKQQQFMDSLERVLETNLRDTTRIRVLITLAAWNSGVNLQNQKRYALEALRLAQEKKDPQIEYDAYGTAVDYYQAAGNYGKSIEYTQMRVRLAKQLKNPMLELANCTSLGYIYDMSLHQHGKSLEYFKKVVAIAKKHKYEGEIPMAYNNLADSYNKVGKPDSAVHYINQAIALMEKDRRRNYSGLCTAYGTKGEISASLKQWEEAKGYILKSLKMSTDIQDFSSHIYFYNRLGKIYEDTEQTDSAWACYQNAVGIYKKYDIKEDVANTYEHLAKIAEKRGQPTRALQYFKEMLALREELAVKDNMERMHIFESEQKDTETNTKFQRVYSVIFIVGGVGAVLLVLLGFIYRQNRVQIRITRALEEKNELITKQSEELKAVQDKLIIQSNQIEAQNQKLERQNLKNTQSIKTALTIQQALLPFDFRVQTMMSDYFVLYMPKDIVSGDFYWIEEAHGKKIMIVADCTGHGVPGAFMSLIGISLLDKIVLQEDITEPSQILMRLHNLVRQALKQEDTKDDNGMDIGVLMWNIADESKYLIPLYFSGAKNTLFYIDAHTPAQVEQLRSGRKTIGGSLNLSASFETKQIAVPKGSKFYMCSDGFFDQNNVKRKKLDKQYFLDIISSPTSMAEQKKMLTNLLDAHMKDTDQRDDITVLGITL